MVFLGRFNLISIYSCTYKRNGRAHNIYFVAGRSDQKHDGTSLQCLLVNLGKQSLLLGKRHVRDEGTWEGNKSGGTGLGDRTGTLLDECVPWLMRKR